MYKQNNTTEEKLVSKIKEHYGKLVKDVERIESIEEFQGLEIIPLLLTNINSKNVLNISQHYLKESFEESKYYNIGNIINLNLLILN